MSRGFGPTTKAERLIFAQQFLRVDVLYQMHKAMSESGLSLAQVAKKMSLTERQFKRRFRQPTIAFIATLFEVCGVKPVIGYEVKK